MFEVDGLSDTQDGRMTIQFNIPMNSFTIHQTKKKAKCNDLVAIYFSGHLTHHLRYLLTNVKKYCIVERWGTAKAFLTLHNIMQNKNVPSGLHLQYI